MLAALLIATALKIDLAEGVAQAHLHRGQLLSVAVLKRHEREARCGGGHSRVRIAGHVLSPGGVGQNTRMQLRVDACLLRENPPQGAQLGAGGREVASDQVEVGDAERNLGVGRVLLPSELGVVQGLVEIPRDLIDGAEPLGEVAGQRGVFCLGERPLIELGGALEAERDLQPLSRLQREPGAALAAVATQEVRRTRLQLGFPLGFEVAPDLGVEPAAVRLAQAIDDLPLIARPGEADPLEDLPALGELYDGLGQPTVGEVAQQPQGLGAEGASKDSQDLEDTELAGTEPAQR